MPEEKPQYPDLRTKEGALDFLAYHAPNDAQTKMNHAKVNDNFQHLLDSLWDNIPDGPGKTIFIRDLNRARMSANSCIANNGA